MLSYPDRFCFKSAPPRASRLMFAWFVFLLLVTVLSVGMLITAIVQAATPDTRQNSVLTMRQAAHYSYSGDRWSSGRWESGLPTRVRQTRKETLTGACREVHEPHEYVSLTCDMSSL